MYNFERVYKKIWLHCVEKKMWEFFLKPWCLTLTRQGERTIVFLLANLWNFFSFETRIVVQVEVGKESFGTRWNFITIEHEFKESH